MKEFLIGFTAYNLIVMITAWVIKEKEGNKFAEVIYYITLVLCWIFILIKLSIN